MPNAKVIQVCIAINVLLKYNRYLNSTNNEANVNLRLQSNKKYQRYSTQVIDELKQFRNFLLAFTVFVNKAYGNYNQKIQLDKHLRFKQDKYHKWVFSYIFKLHVSIQYLKIDRKNIAKMFKLIKKFVSCFLI